MFKDIGKLVTAMLIAGGCHAAAQAGEISLEERWAADVRTTRVLFADLDLNSPAAQGRLHRRVRNAIEQVCVHENQKGTLSVPYKRCAGSAWSEAEPQIRQAIRRSQEIALHGRSSIAARPIVFAAR